MPPKFEVQGKENFPTIKDGTFAKDEKTAKKNVGWEHGLRGEELADFIETAMAKKDDPSGHNHQKILEETKIEPQDLLDFLYNDIEKTRKKIEGLEEKKEKRSEEDKEKLKELRARILFYEHLVGMYETKLDKKELKEISEPDLPSLQPKEKESDNQPDLPFIEKDLRVNGVKEKLKKIV